MEQLVTRDSLILLITSDKSQVHAIGRALVHIFNRQVKDEKKHSTTKYHNRIGFTPADARCGTITAKYYIKHNTLQDWQIAKWLKPNKKDIPRLAKYWSQLNDVANEIKEKNEQIS